MDRCPISRERHIKARIYSNFILCDRSSSELLVLKLKCTLILNFELLLLTWYTTNKIYNKPFEIKPIDILLLLPLYPKSTSY